MVIIFCLFQIFINQNKIITDFNQNIMNQEFNTENKIENEEISKFGVKNTVSAKIDKEVKNLTAICFNLSVSIEFSKVKVFCIKNPPKYLLILFL